jgi:hypothetical protein
MWQLAIQEQRTGGTRTTKAAGFPQTRKPTRTHGRESIELFHGTIYSGAAMIDAPKAVQIAQQQAVLMLGQPHTNLEEIERESHNGREVWDITLSFPRKLEQLAPMARLAADALQYKRFLIDIETGELVAIKIRELASR